MNHMNVEARLQKLERENRWFKRLGVAIAAIGLAALVLGQVADKDKDDNEARVIEAEKYVLKRADGTIAGTWLVSELGAGFNLGLPNGPEVTLVAGKEVSGVNVVDREAKTGVFLSFRAGEGPAIALLGKGGAERVAIWADEEDSTGLRLVSREGSTKSLFYVKAEGSAINLFDNKGKMRSQWSAGTGASLRILDKDEKNRAVLTGKELVLVRDDGTPAGKMGASKDGAGVTLYNQNGQRVSLVADKKSLSLDFLDKDHQPRVTLATTTSSKASMLLLADKNGNDRVAISDMGGQGSGVFLFGKDKVRRSALWVDDGGSARLMVNAPEGTGGVEIGSDKAGQRLKFVGTNGKVRCGFAFDDTFSGFSLSDSAGQARVAIGANAESTVVRLYDKDGKTRGDWQAGANTGLTIRDDTGKARAVVGCTAAKHETTGAETTFPESTLTLFDDNGRLLFQAPRE